MNSKFGAISGWPAHDDWLRPTWQRDDVGALMTTRAGGCSDGPYASMNVGAAVGDEPQAVACNRNRLRTALDGATPTFLRQVHGSRVIRLDEPNAEAPQADASLTTVPGVACVVQAADCLPVLLAAPGGRGVGAAHAGWRGLASGVLEATVLAVCDAAGCVPSAIEVWLGACIGPRRFEVGADVVTAFAGAGLSSESRAACFRRVPVEGIDRSTPAAGDKWLADLPGLARLRLAKAGVRRISGGIWCTVEDPSRFFSFRRDHVCGRMAAAIWIRPR